MTEFREHDLTGARFEGVSLRGAIFTRVFLNDASMRAVDLTGSQVHGALFNGSRMRGVELVDVEISGELQNFIVNGVDIAPLAQNKDTRAAVLAALREIFDGSWTRHVGTDGGRTLHWEGKVGLIAGCTRARTGGTRDRRASPASRRG